MIPNDQLISLPTLIVGFILQSNLADWSTPNPGRLYMYPTIRMLAFLIRRIKSLYGIVEQIASPHKSYIHTSVRV